MRRNIRPLFIGKSKLAFLKPVYDVVGWTATIGTINYIVAPFVVHSVENSLKVWGGNYFVGHLVLVGIEVGFGVLGLRGVVRSVGRSLGAEFPAHVHAGKNKGVKEEVKKEKEDWVEAEAESDEDEDGKKLMEDIVDGTAVPAFDFEGEERRKVD